MGLHAASLPSPNMTYGLPPFTISTCGAAGFPGFRGQGLLNLLAPYVSFWWAFPMLMPAGEASWQRRQFDSSQSQISGLRHSV